MNTITIQSVNPFVNKVSISSNEPDTLKITISQTLAENTSIQQGITANPIGDQTNATQLTHTINFIDNATLNNSSVKTPKASRGKICEIHNLTDYDILVYPFPDDQFQNAATLLSTNQPLTLSAGNGIRLMAVNNSIFRYY